MLSTPYLKVYIQQRLAMYKEEHHDFDVDKLNDLIKSWAAKHRKTRLIKNLIIVVSAFISFAFFVASVFGIYYSINSDTKIMLAVVLFSTIALITVPFYLFQYAKLNKL